MASKAKEIIAKAKQEEAAARAKKRQGEKLLQVEYATALTKHFPEVNDADDVDTFLAHVRKQYDANAPRESSHVTAPQVQPKPYEPVTQDDGFPFPDD